MRQSLDLGGLDTCRLQGVAGAAVMVVRVRTNGAEVTPQRLQGVPLRVDLTSRAEAEPPQDRQWWAPALDRMLEQKAGDDRR